MKIRLISPRSTKRPMDTDWKTHMSPPLSLLVLSALTPDVHSVEIVDENIETHRFDDSPDLVGITIKVDTAMRAFAIAARYRSRGIPVVLGGIHVTACPEHCAPHANAIVIGEAEHVWCTVLRDCEQGTLLPVYQSDKPVDLADTPVPRWDALKRSRYMFTNTITISRGCPWKCDFCYTSAPNFHAPYRTKPLAHILREIRSLNSDHVMFIDDNIIGDPNFARVLLNALKGMNLTWHAAVTANIVHYEDILDLMAQTGCKSLFIGFESIDQNNLLSCHKKQNNIDDYERLIHAIHRRGIMVNASLVFGFDRDTAAVFPSTLRWLIENKIETMTAHILTPYPGTPFYRKLLLENRIFDHDLSHYNTAHAVFMPKNISPDALTEHYHKLYHDFYSWGSILQRLPVDRKQHKAYLSFNLLYRKYGTITAQLGKLFGMNTLAKAARLFSYRPKKTERELHDRKIIYLQKRIAQ